MRQGVAAAEAALRHAHAAEQEAQAKLVGEGTTADDDAYKAENAALVRQGAKGQALVSTEVFFFGDHGLYQFGELEVVGGWRGREGEKEKERE